MTYRTVWRQARAGAYGDPSVRGVVAIWRDLVSASMPVIRPAMMLAVLGWGQPNIAEAWRAHEHIS
jgi:hypothetical protein